MSLDLQQTAYAIAMSKWTVRKLEAEDPTFPKRKQVPWNPNGPGKFDKIELLTWLASRRSKALTS